MPEETVSRRMGWLFLAAVAVMMLHKVECWFGAEWRVSPLFQWLITSGPWAGVPREEALGEAIFLTFVAWLGVGLMLGAAALRGGGWALFALAMWGLTIVLETHHIVRSVVDGRPYVGVWTALLYLPLMMVYWGELWACIRRWRVGQPASARRSLGGSAEEGG